MQCLASIGNFSINEISPFPQQEQLAPMLCVKKEECQKQTLSRSCFNNTAIISIFNCFNRVNIRTYDSASSFRNYFRIIAKLQ